MQPQTPSVRLATVILGESLGDWVARRRSAGESWERIADALAVSTNQQVKLSGQWLRRLYSEATTSASGDAA